MKVRKLIAVASLFFGMVAYSYSAQNGLCIGENCNGGVNSAVAFSFQISSHIIVNSTITSDVTSRIVAKFSSGISSPTVYIARTGTLLDVVNGSVTIRGTGAGLSINGGGISLSTSQGAPSSVSGYSQFFSSWDAAASNQAEMYVLDGAGNNTRISPHGKNNKWVFYSHNQFTGKGLFVPMEEMIAEIEKITGTKWRFKDEEEYYLHRKK